MTVMMIVVVMVAKMGLLHLANNRIPKITYSGEGGRWVEEGH